MGVPAPLVFKTDNALIADCVLEIQALLVGHADRFSSLGNIFRFTSSEIVEKVKAFLEWYLWVNDIYKGSDIYEWYDIYEWHDISEWYFVIGVIA